MCNFFTHTVKSKTVSNLLFSSYHNYKTFDLTFFYTFSMHLLFDIKVQILQNDKVSIQMCKVVDVTKIIIMERHAQHILLFFSFIDKVCLAFECKKRHHVVFRLQLIDEYILPPRVSYMPRNLP